MDFFAAQAKARKNSRMLIFLFCGVVLTVVCALYPVLALLTQQQPFFDLGLFLWVLLGGAGVLLALAFFHGKRIRRGGGAAVAHALGGRRVMPDTAVPHEAALLRHVETMALAAGMATPAVFILDREKGLNAFAAGNGLQDSVVAVTHGLLMSFPKDELEAVIGHEVSHILHGDTRLNMRLMGVVSGLFTLHVLGRFLMASTRRRPVGAAAQHPARPHPVWPALGLALLGLGALGAFAGRLIQAALSREREFLADAGAARVTHNPEALARALERIAQHGAHIRHPRAEEARHFFLAGFSSDPRAWLATHPPIVERVRRLRASMAETAVERAPAHVSFSTAHNTTAQNSVEAGVGIGEPDHAHLQTAQALLASLPPRLDEAVHRPLEAAMLVGALLVTPAPSPARKNQLAQLRVTYGETGLAFFSLLQTTQTALAHPALRLALMNLALPALIALPAASQAKLLQLSESLMTREGQLDLFGLSIRLLLRKRLDRNPFYQPIAPSAHSLREESSLVLGMMAYSDADTETQARLRFQVALAHAPVDYMHLPSVQTIIIERLEPALASLAQTPLLFRKALIEAALAMIRADARLVWSELEGLCALCEALECPMPLPALPLSTADTDPSSFPSPPP